MDPDDFARDHPLLTAADVHDFIEAVRAHTRAVHQQTVVQRDQREMMRRLVEQTAKLVEHTANLPALLALLVARSSTNGNALDHTQEGTDP